MLASEPPSRKALRIALFYGLAAVLWIALTDPLAAYLANTPEVFTRISMIKGLTFVAVTAALLFWLLRKDYGDLRQTGEAMEENQRLLKEVLETLPVGVWLLDRQGMIVQGNREGTRIWGGAHYVGIEDFGLYRGWWVASGKPIEAKEWGAARAILKGEKSLNEEIEIEGFDGERRFILHSAVPLTDEMGAIKGAIIVNQDITSLKQAQTTLQSTKEFLSKLLDNSPAHIYVTAADGRIRLVNQAYRKAHGLESKQVVGLHAEQIFPPATAAHYLEHNRQVLATQSVITCEEYADQADGRHYYQAVKFPVHDIVEGEMAAAGISIDITEIKKFDEYRQAYHAQLAAMASELTLTEERERRRIAVGLHDEIAQTLALARIRLGQLAAEASSEEFRRMAEGVRKLIEETIRQVRTFIFDLSPPVLYELGLEAALRSLAERIASQHGLAVDFETDGRPKELSEGLQVLLYQAARELLVNVLKHAQASQAKIVIGRERETVRLAIEDDGVGFEAGRGQREGFGLSSIRERLRHLGGEMEITAHPGRGTRIVLSVPVGGRPEKGSPS